MRILEEIFAATLEPIINIYVSAPSADVYIRIKTIRIPSGPTEVGFVVLSTMPSTTSDSSVPKMRKRWFILLVYHPNNWEPERRTVTASVVAASTVKKIFGGCDG